MVNRLHLSRLTRTMLTVVAFTLAACRDEPTRPVGQSSAQRTTVQGDAGAVPSGERLFAELANRVPSAAGFYFDAPTRIMVNVANAGDGARAVAVVEEFLQRADIVVPSDQSIAVRWRQVKYTYSELSRIRNLIFDRAFSGQQGFVMLDLDEENNRVLVGTTAHKPRTTS